MFFCFNIRNGISNVVVIKLKRYYGFCSFHIRISGMSTNPPHLIWDYSNSGRNKRLIRNARTLIWALDSPLCSQSDSASPAKRLPGDSMVVQFGEMTRGYFCQRMLRHGMKFQWRGFGRSRWCSWQLLVIDPHSVHGIPPWRTPMERIHKWETIWKIITGC